VSIGEFVFLLTTEGMLTCFKAEDGTKLWDKDINETFMASPSVVGDKLFLLSNEGVMFVVEAGGREYKEIARSELGEDCYASCAFADGRMYIRGAENLYCIGNVD
jgi:outer membrane protein assembly factor BamB